MGQLVYPSAFDGQQRAWEAGTQVRSWEVVVASIAAVLIMISIIRIGVLRPGSGWRL
jgi:hypothetical protein